MTERVQIGDAVLYRGDCLDVMETLDPVDAVVTDPPYGMGFQSNYRKAKHAPIENDQTTNALDWACDLSAGHSKYIFCRWDNLRGVPHPKSAIVWVKNNWSMGDLNHEHARQTEIILFYPGSGHYFPTARPTDCIHAPRSGNELHPTEKPIQLMRPVVRWTAGTVVDPFMGSGTTGVACAKLGRKFIGIEIDERYFQIACKRVEAAYAQGDMFVEPPAKAVQEKLVLDSGSAK